MISEEEKKKIRLLALGKKEHKEECEKIYFRELRLKKMDSAEIDFMREYFNICPCYILKNLYKRRLFGLEYGEKLNEEKELKKLEN
jgi:hypothetical protein